MFHRAQTIYLVPLLVSKFILHCTSQWCPQLALSFLITFIVEIRIDIFILWGSFQQWGAVDWCLATAVFKSDHVSAIHYIFIVWSFGCDLQIIGGFIKIPQVLLAQYGRSRPKICSRILLSKWSIVFRLGFFAFLLDINLVAGSPLSHIPKLTPLFEQLLLFKVFNCGLSQMVIELLYFTVLRS